MKIMVVGGGGREHAIIKKLKENKEIEILEIQITEAIGDRNLLKDLYNKYNLLEKGHLEVTPINVPTNHGDKENEE